MRLFRSHYERIFIVQTPDSLQGWVIRAQGIFYMPVERGSFYFSCTERPWVGWKLRVSPSYWGPNSAITGGNAWWSVPSPCQPPCKGIRVVCEFLWDVGSDFQTPGLPCRGGEQHVLVPQVTEEPHLGNLVWPSSDFSVCQQAGKHFHPSSWYFPGFVMPGIGHEVPISCRGTQSCVHSHAAGARNTWTSLWHQENHY